MAFRIICLLSMCLALSTVVASQEAGWRGIVPLHSTRADVEKLLGRSTDRGYGATYDLRHEAVTFQYSSCRCCKPIEYRWNVPDYTVVTISVSATFKPLFSELGIDKTKFRKIVSDHLPDVSTYHNDEEGITYEVLNDQVMSTVYGPSAKDDKALRCSQVLKLSSAAKSFR